MPWIYLIQERESERRNEHIYKLGMTRQVDSYMRIRNYPKGSTLLGLYMVKDCVKMEKSLIYLFKQQFRQVVEYGSEYFEGDVEDMVACITEEVRQEQLQYRLQLVLTFNKYGEPYLTYDTLSEILPQAIQLWKTEMENQEW